MKCDKCSNKAIFSNPNLCKEHFKEYYQNKVVNCIKKYHLLSKSDKVCVATSGGKDSLTVLYLLKTLGYNVSALLIDEGIHDYRAHTEKDLKTFCDKYNVNLEVVSFKKDFGYSLDEMLKKVSDKPCTVCGTFRRYLLNKASRNFDKLATGHNLDDEAQAVLMNYLRDQLVILSRLGPKTGTVLNKKFTQRVKPLYFCSEKENMTYSFLMGFTSYFTECPYVTQAYRASIRDFLNNYELTSPGAKLNLINNFLEILPKLKEKFKEGSAEICEVCGEPSANKVCNACNLLNKLNE